MTQILQQLLIKDEGFPQQHTTLNVLALFWYKSTNTDAALHMQQLFASVFVLLYQKSEALLLY
jgi:hypothetical protein